MTKFSATTASCANLNFGKCTKIYEVRLYTYLLQTNDNKSDKCKQPVVQVNISQLAADNATTTLLADIKSLVRRVIVKRVRTIQGTVRWQ